MTAPNLPALVYDGDCGFCTTCARWVERRLGEGSGVTVVPWQFADLRALGLTPPDVMHSAWWVDADRTRRAGHLAVAAVLRRLGGVWVVPGVAMSVPPISWVARGVYRLVATFRHRMPGGTAACRIGPAPPGR